jgi:concanavalin A-like lectin/glucanase superfamily protein/Big-like domain-containing protein/fibronectin type III domain protein
MLPKHLKLLRAAIQLLLCLGWISQALAGEVTLAWNATTTNTDGTPATDLAGYNLYYWQGSTGTPQSLSVGNTTTYTLTDLTDGATYSFAVTAYNTSGTESSYSNTVTATVPSGNQAPLASDDTASATTGTPVTITVLANDTDADGNPLTLTSVTQGAHGTVTISGTSVIYTPAAGFVGTDSFTYTITDGQGASAIGTVTVNVLAGDQPPVASSDTVSIPAGTSITIAVLKNDTDPYGYSLSITAVTQGAHGTVTFESTSVTYTPAAGFIDTDSFTYTITDGYDNYATATVTVTVLSDRAASLVAAYNFNEGSGTTIIDASGNNNTGTIKAAKWTTEGKFGNGLVFNGTNALVTIPDTSWLRLTTAMTLEAWVKPSRVTNVWRDVIRKGINDYFLDATSDHNKVPAGGGTFGTTKTVVWGTAGLTANTWTHLAVTYDGMTLRLYVNGAQVSSQAKTGNLAMSANSLQIGGDSRYGHYFKGTIDEVRIYNQELLPSEIVADMQTPVQRSAVAAYGLHEIAGTTVADAAGYNNTGTLSSGVTRSTQGTFGSALVFNGSSLVTIPAAASLHLATAMTLEAWVSDTATPTNWSTALMKEQPDTLAYTLYAGSPAHRPNVYVNPATSSSGEHGFADSRPYL